jgi:hypothetical protein
MASHYAKTTCTMFSFNNNKKIKFAEYLSSYQLVLAELSARDFIFIFNTFKWPTLLKSFEH